MYYAGMIGEPGEPSSNDQGWNRGGGNCGLGPRNVADLTAKGKGEIARASSWQ